MKAALIAALAFASVAQAQPIRTDKIVNNIQKPPAERIEACRSGCYVLTHQELAAGLMNVAQLATLRAKRAAQETKP